MKGSEEKEPGKIGHEACLYPMLLLSSGCDMELNRIKWTRRFAPERSDPSLRVRLGPSTEQFGQLHQVPNLSITFNKAYGLENEQQ